MRIFTCPACNRLLYFENLRCSCGTEVAFDPEAQTFLTDVYLCGHRETIACNWRMQDENTGLCRSCAMTEDIPDLSLERNRMYWGQAEDAKRRVLAVLGRWGWFSFRDNGMRPVFRMLAEETREGEVPVVMGHADGIVTINVTEADPAESAERREVLGERYRTMTGHFRHELGHFFFDRFALAAGFLDEFRSRFGDERADYAEALKAHYAAPRSDNWRGQHVTAYAGSHPHEDWAESFAHLLHLTDIVDSTLASGLSAPSLPPPPYDAYLERDAEFLISAGIDLGIALNHVNRSMGLDDIYPFVLTKTIRDKLSFAHRWIRELPEPTLAPQ